MENPPKNGKNSSLLSPIRRTKASKNNLRSATRFLAHVCTPDLYMQISIYKSIWPPQRHTLTYIFIYIYNIDIFRVVGPIGVEHEVPRGSWRRPNAKKVKKREGKWNKICKIYKIANTNTQVNTRIQTHAKQRGIYFSCCYWLRKAITTTKEKPTTIHIKNAFS